jgi:hypothetical protein
MVKFFKIATILAVILVLCFFSYDYVMTSGARDLTKEEPEFMVTSNDISAEFTANVAVATKKYSDKAIAITGIVTATSGIEVILGHSIICNMQEVDPTIQKNQKVTLKGRVVGYDDLMGEIKLDQCLVIK